MTVKAVNFILLSNIRSYVSETLNDFEMQIQLKAELTLTGTRECINSKSHYVVKNNNNTFMNKISHLNV